MLWRHWWRHRGWTGFILHNLRSSLHIWSQNMDFEDFRFSTSDVLSNQNRNRNLIVLEKCRLVSHRLWEYLFPPCTKKLPIYGNFKISLAFCPGDVIDGIMSMQHMTCTTRHPQLYSGKILFVWYQSFMVKSSGQTSWQTHKQTHKETHRVKTLSLRRYLQWASRPPHRPGQVRCTLQW